MRPALAAAAAVALLAGRDARADTPITYAQALDRAAHAAPDLLVARSREAVMQAEVGIAGTLPNPTASIGTSTQAARLSAGVSIPLVVLGQRGAAIDASRAELATTRVETELAAVDVRASAAHAYVALWRAQGTAAEAERAATIARHLEEAVSGRVELGASANVDGLRAKAERLRSEAAAAQAALLVDAAGSDLARWLGVEDGGSLRAQDSPPIPNSPPAFADLRARIEVNPAIRREKADYAAAQARIDRERALVRPGLSLDLGLDAYDRTLCPADNPNCTSPPVNYRAGLGIDLPLLNQRGAYVDRERANAVAARTREVAERTRVATALSSAYRTFQAWSASARALETGVVPAANAAAAATEESYTLGRAPLVAVLDAEKARSDANLSLLDARAQEADAWIEVEHAVGMP